SVCCTARDVPLKRSLTNGRRRSPGVFVCTAIAPIVTPSTGGRPDAAAIGYLRLLQRARPPRGRRGKEESDDAPCGCRSRPHSPKLAAPSSFGLALNGTSRSGC